MRRDQPPRAVKQSIKRLQEQRATRRSAEATRIVAPIKNVKMSDEQLQKELAEEKATSEALQQENAVAAKTVEDMRARMRELEKRLTTDLTAGTPAVRQPANAVTRDEQQLSTPQPGYTQSDAGIEKMPAWASTLALVMRSCITPVPPPPQRPRIAYIDEANTLTKFSGQDELLPVKSWKRSVDELAAAGMGTRHFAAKRALTGAAADWILTRSDLQSWIPLGKAIESTFEYEVDEFHIMEKLMRGRPKKDEPLIQYMHHMRRLASQANISDKLTLKYTVTGIPDNAFNKVLLHVCTNFEELKKALANYEAARREQKEHSNKQRGDQHAPKPNGGHAKKQEDKGREAGKCYNCGHTGHKSRECPEKSKKPKCFACNLSVHISRECTNKLNASQREKTKAVNLVQEKEDDSIYLVQNEEKSNSHVQVLLGGVEVSAMLDSGARKNILRADQWDEIRKATSPVLEVTEYLGQLKGFGRSVVRTPELVTLPSVVDGAQYDLEYLIVPRRAVEERVLIGDPLQKMARLIFDPDRATVVPLVGTVYIRLVQQELDEAERVMDAVSTKYQAEVKKLVADYKPEGRETAPVKMHIVMKNEVPISCRPRKLSPQEAGINEKTPMPIVEDVLESLSEAVVFSTIDLKNGFFHVEVYESRKYTVFVTPEGQYKFCRVSFGLSTSPAVFTRFVRYVFAELIRRKVIVLFMDDEIIKATTYEEAIDNFKKVLETAARFGLKINWKKCQLLQKKVEFLGHVVEGGKISPRRPRRRP
ncbi:hypothetical protein TSAR_010531 [Trichomalopsis sarcophagae]|uniref:CCHC-type domain-containing protein n=1 Tax=Trichomalopsis sarcophagae TaxID=543379 RepID=A0A232EEC1_9HYME|nr:hypothetical protein TSAR_010531 [Trichomalopsis sarcophagae]